MTQQMLVSFNHNVAVVIDGRIISIWAAVCEEVFQGEMTVVAKRKEQKQEDADAINNAQKLTLDFPIMLRVLSLGDGKPLDRPMEIMVKWSNISAICNFEESWIKGKKK